VPVGEHVPVIVRHHGLRGVAAADLASTNDDWNVHALIRNLLESCLELGTLGRFGRVALDRLIDRRWHAARSGEAG
jgi:hypothetical protein